MACGVCGVPGHNVATCPHDAPRVSFAGTRARRCECCGQTGYEIHRHHTRGRGDDSDYLDVCTDCHLKCCHDGHYQNIGIKPRICRMMNRPSDWRR